MSSGRHQGGTILHLIGIAIEAELHDLRVLRVERLVPDAGTDSIVTIGSYRWRQLIPAPMGPANLDYDDAMPAWGA
jgi:hypothetical protein